jgi:hypothetical protein
MLMDELKTPMFLKSSVEKHFAVLCYNVRLALFVQMLLTYPVGGRKVKSYPAATGVH